MNLQNLKSTEILGGSFNDTILNLMIGGDAGEEWGSMWWKIRTKETRYIPDKL